MTQAADRSLPEQAEEASATERGLALALRVLALLVAAVLVLPGLGEAHLFGDEYHSVRNLGRGYGELLRSYDRFGSGLLLPLLQKLGVDLAGPGLVTYRWPALAGALASLLLAYPVARFFLRPVPAALVVVVLAANPIFVFYARYGRAYALAAAFALLFLWGVLAVLERGRRGWAVVVGGALMPFAHLFTAVLAGSVGLVALGLAARSPKGRLRALLVPLAVGGALAIALHLPAFASLTAFTEEKTFAGPPQPFDALHVGTVMYGCRTSAWLVAGGILIALALLARERVARALLLGTAALAPALGLVVAQPAGLTFAYARYLVPSLAFQVVLLVLLLDRLVAVLTRKRSSGALRAGATAGLGLLAVAVHFACGPLGTKRDPDGPFALSNLSLVPLPVFDESWPGASPFYARLASNDADLTVIEAPELWNRSQLLYRNHWLAHEKRVLSGVLFEKDPSRIPAGFTVNLRAPALREALEASGADYLVLHTNIYRELANYWVFVNRTWEREGTSDLDPMMDALADPAMAKDRLDQVLAVAAELEALLGPPGYADVQVSVWSLR